MNKFILVLALVMFGCANNQIIEQSKREAAYRKLLDEDQNTTTPTAGTGPIEMPKEWMDQWRDTPIDKNQK
jgi:hypothetical protein